MAPCFGHSLKDVDWFLKAKAACLFRGWQDGWSEISDLKSLSDPLVFHASWTYIRAALLCGETSPVCNSAASMSKRPELHRQAAEIEGLREVRGKNRRVLLYNTQTRMHRYRRRVGGRGGAPAWCLPPEALWFLVGFNLRRSLASLLKWKSPSPSPRLHSLSPRAQTNKPQMTTTCYLCQIECMLNTGGSGSPFTYSSFCAAVSEESCD